MSGSWLVRPDHHVVVGSFGDVEEHHHPAVQIAVGLGGAGLDTTDGSGASRRGRVVLIASGARHAMSGAGESLSIYFSPDTDVASVLNACALAHGSAGVLVCAEEPLPVVECAAAAGHLGAAADLVLAFVLARLRLRVVATKVHPQLREAIDAVAVTIPGRASLTDVADEVALSPDYLGRLFRTQTGASFSATVQWRRLFVALEHIGSGSSITDAAHLAGFADGAHATRVCRALTGAPPSALVRAFG